MFVQNDKNQTSKNLRVRETYSKSLAPGVEQILNLLRNKKHLTRQEIERTCEMGRTAVTDRLSVLSDIGFINEGSLGVTTGGRAPRLIQFNADAGRFLVASIEQEVLGVGMADLSGNLLTEHHENIDANASSDQIMKHLIALFDLLLDREVTNIDVLGIGLSIPGPVESFSNSHFFYKTPSMPSAWADAPLIEQLLSYYKAPVWIRGSVEAMAMGQTQSLDTFESETVLFVKVSNRIEASLIINGSLYQGANGLTGLIGHTPVESAGATSSLNSVAGELMVAKLGNDAANSGQSKILENILAQQANINAIDVSNAARAADHVAMEILSNCGRRIGQNIATIANMLNPSRIIISGSLVQDNDILLAAIREMIYRNAHPLISKDTLVEASVLGHSAGLIGSAAIAADGLFEPAYLKQWVLYGHPANEPKFKGLLGELNQDNRIEEFIVD